MNSAFDFFVAVALVIISSIVGYHVALNNISRDCDLLNSTIIYDEVYNCASTRKFTAN